ncbi:MAG: ThuA domain-containing protein [Verrucomicrobiae bacterium]|nr:ThuA domain-containing protein [Verrucomicrobiae bacterium]
MIRLLSLILASHVAFNLPAADLQSFQGSWVITEAEFDGAPVPGGELLSAVLTIEDGRYGFLMGDLQARGTVTLDASRSPAVMVFEETDGPNVGRQLRGVAELAAEGWRACYAMGEGGIPDGFKTEPGSGRLLLRYARKPGTRTAGPLRVLLVTGGCCHDYATQKELLKAGLESRANVRVDIVYSPDTSTRPPLAILGNPDYAQGYDVVLHDECAADVNDPEVVRGVLAPHRKGIPGVNLHCAMHSYRTGNPGQAATPGTPHALWFEYLGLQSSGHGPQKPIELTFTDPVHPITRGMTAWTTINEELYNNVKVWESAQPLVQGRQGDGDRPGQNNAIVAWTHEYGPAKARVFSTTLGHNNDTVADARYLDLVTRGLLWACGRLQEDGRPAVGAGAGGQ